MDSSMGGWTDGYLTGICNVTGSPLGAQISGAGEPLDGPKSTAAILRSRQFRTRVVSPTGAITYTCVCSERKFNRKQ